MKETSTRERALQSFTQIFDAGVGNGFWKNWELDTSALQDVRFVYVKFWTGSYITLGPYNGRISYPGEVQRCYICGSQDQVNDCETLKCWKCGEFGPRGKECKNTEICNLCQEQGHTYFKCPSSYSNKAHGLTPMPPTDINTAQNGEHQENTAPQTSEVIQEVQNCIEGPAQINNGEEVKSTSSISDSSDTSSSGSRDSSSEDLDSSEGILPPSGHQKVTPGQEDTGAGMTSGRQLPENKGDNPDNSDSLQDGSLPPTQSSTAILSRRSRTL
ncbi:hypothetical protein SRHO_G00223930 [Serrasalmus rhombeus]